MPRTQLGYDARSPLAQTGIHSVAPLLALVFVTVFAIVALIAFRLLARRTPDAPASSTWNVNLNPTPAVSNAVVDLDNVVVNIRINEPFTLTFSDAHVQRAVDTVRQGLPIADAARAVYPDYEQLNEIAKTALHAALEQMAKQH
ncbi:MAG TPA: hypothetical protein VEK56_03380 [Vicinamibacterales bacterium]|nr:hypothetical protein [Vicinamibacterales bacterium]